MTKGHSRLRTFCRGKQPAKEFNKPIQPSYNGVWKAHLCPEILRISVRNLAEESKDREGLGETLGILPRKQEHSAHSSNSSPGERLGESVLGRESEGQTSDLCSEGSSDGLGRLRAGGRAGRPLQPVLGLGSGASSV